MPQTIMIKCNPFCHFENQSGNLILFNVSTNANVGPIHKQELRRQKGPNIMLQIRHEEMDKLTKVLYN